MAGLRERKKAATRQHISDVATRLIMEKGFDQVGVREIAEAAQVSPTTLFSYFPSKEAMFIDRDEELERQLVDTIRDRPEGTTALRALRDLLVSRFGVLDHPGSKDFVAMVRSTPSLMEHWRQIGMRHQVAVARELAAAWDRPEDDTYAWVVAHSVLGVREQLMMSDAPQQVVDATFEILERGLPFPSR